MTSFLLILTSTVLVNNFVLVKFLGLCPFMGVSRQLDGAYGMALATGFVLTLAATISWVVHHWVLVPLELDYLRTLSFILVIAVLVQFTEVVMQRRSPRLYRVLGIFLPLITTNCAVLGVALLNVQAQHSLLEAMLYGFGAALGFGLVLVLFSAMRERVEHAGVPASFRGAPIALLTAAFMALAFLGFSGLGAGLESRFGAEHDAGMAASSGAGSPVAGSPGASSPGASSPGASSPDASIDAGRSSGLAGRAARHRAAQPAASARDTGSAHAGLPARQP